METANTPFLALGQLEKDTREEVVSHLMNEYAGENSGFSSSSPEGNDFEIAKNTLSTLDLLLAYEHVGDYGCDSSSFFIFKSNQNDDYYELHGGHCSCFGFEGQLKDLEKTTLIALKDRASKDTLLYLGGYDYDNQNKIKANEFVLAL